ncbi:hypothetical protein MTR67_035100 [Solanum verrucosum]|uniref:Integrase zinc-binding domain-containing protein n=1 Tax=Solanum verrucosum TaxID=315347 RepID=A0AAF0U9N7_SOLVR|nr:hypothetical protein MTR67_035100 [Solanum verrucosum]
MVRNGFESSYVMDVKSKQGLDLILVELEEAVLKKSVEAFFQGGDGVLRYQGRLCVPNVDGLREKILEEAHGSQYSIHPGVIKMYHDLREVYWWNGMKKDIAEFVAKCPNCQQVKVEHQRLGGLSQDIAIPTWKWEDVNVDFIVGLPHTRWQHDLIWVIVDRMTKSAHFIPIKVSYSTEEYAKMYLREIVRLHGIPLSIISGVSCLNVEEMCWDATYIVPLEGLEIKENLAYEEVPVEILDRQDKRLRNKEVSFVKVLWRNHLVEGAT